jgi:hypothetical protein
MKPKFRFKNRKIKFREADYIEKHYIRDGKAIIPIYLKSIDDLYMKHDYKKLALSDDVCDYIEEIAYLIPANVDIVLEVHYFLNLLFFGSGPPHLFVDTLVLLDRFIARTSLADLASGSAP